MKMDPNGISGQVQNILSTTGSRWKDDGSKVFAKNVEDLTSILKGMQETCEGLDEALNVLGTELDNIKEC
jgi:hypothetical protein